MSLAGKATKTSLLKSALSSFNLIQFVLHSGKNKSLLIKVALFSSVTANTCVESSSDSLLRPDSDPAAASHLIQTLHLKHAMQGTYLLVFQKF